MSELRIVDEGFDTAPPPNAALRALVAQGKPVSTRQPVLQLVVWLGIAGVLATISVLGVGMRVDRDALPQMPFVLSATLWSLAIVAGASLVFMPPAHQVLPSRARAKLGLFIVLALALIAGLAVPVDAPGLTRHLDGADAWHGIFHCGRFGILLALPALLLAWVLVLRRIPVGGAAVGAAIGAAAGAMSGLALHLVCASGGPLHLAFGHVAVVFVGALVGAVTTRR